MWRPNSQTSSVKSSGSNRRPTPPTEREQRIERLSWENRTYSTVSSREYQQVDPKENNTSAGGGGQEETITIENHGPIHEGEEWKLPQDSSKGPSSTNKGESHKKVHWLPRDERSIL
ncbi:uncharacterized protein L201_006341 [Kwoniella dendrophila CBS 6074]|uniref:Hypervirulence associated protein TUDOR domain-containing protein n=1 Tax=Kwoniella dendrophila CBS 6074 TaxID=1295534 RepID=A0AAX4K1F3_9TREE